MSALETISVKVFNNILYSAWKLLKQGKIPVLALKKNYIQYFKLHNHIKNRGLWEDLGQIRSLYANGDQHLYILVAFRVTLKKKQFKIILMNQKTLLMTELKRFAPIKSYLLRK